ncbi:hypothetical protein DL93DRAFT_2146214 [Clavulina sp. PMI_390]|nr:hypothetical protein DL93DRAFT_2146214 [Clavulina sp. PMI_390]
MIERGHRTWIESIWKLCYQKPKMWSDWFYAAMWADRITVRRSTHYSPYYLVFGRAHVFPFNLDEPTWYTIQWNTIRNTVDLVAARAQQLRRLREDRLKANKSNVRTRIEAARAHDVANAKRLISGRYRRGEFVLVATKGYDVNRPRRSKSDERWVGPFKVQNRYRSGSYQLKDLNKTILSGSFPASHLKPFYTRGEQVIGEELVDPIDDPDDPNEFASSSGEEELVDDDYSPTEEENEESEN